MLERDMSSSWIGSSMVWKEAMEDLGKRPLEITEDRLLFGSAGAFQSNL
jgi:hypothetical protein